MALVADMQALKLAAGVEERDPDVRAKPCVGPRMLTGFQPWHLAAKWKKDPDTYELLSEAGWFNRIRAASETPEGGEAPAGPGFIHSAKLTRDLRYGLRGLPAKGRTKVSETLQLLEEQRQLLAFWTVTLPTEVLLALNRRDSWPKFVKRIHQKLVRLLQRALGAAVIVGVVEVQPGRSAATGIPCLHLHIVFVGRRHRNAAWAISKAALDRIIKEAAEEAGLDEKASFKSAGNVQPVKRSVRAYLSKYMTKGSGDVQRFVGGPYENLIPRQWWLWSKAARDLLQSCTVSLPTPFMCWLWRHREQLVQEGRFYVQQCEVPDGAPATYRILWGNAYKLSTLIAEWQEFVEDAYITAKRELGIYTSMGQSLYARPL